MTKLTSWLRTLAGGGWWVAGPGGCLSVWPTPFPVAIAARTLPKSRHAVGVERRVHGDKCQSLDQRCRNDEPVEGVLVVERHRREGLDVLRFQRQQMNVLRCQTRGEEYAERLW